MLLISEMVWEQTGFLRLADEQKFGRRVRFTAHIWMASHGKICESFSDFNCICGSRDTQHADHECKQRRLGVEILERKIQDKPVTIVINLLQLRSGRA